MLHGDTMNGAISCGPLVGAVVRRRNLRLVTITETAYAPDLVIEKHSHPFPYYCAVLQGAFDDSAGTSRRFCDDTSMFFRPTEEVHSDRFQRLGARCLTIELKQELIEQIAMVGMGVSWIGQPRHYTGGAFFSLSRRLRDELARWDPFSMLAVEGLVYELISQAGRHASPASGRGPSWLRTVVEFVRTNFQESITLAQVAETVRVHPTHLARVFRQAHGCTVGEFIRKERIKYCCGRLARAEIPLGQIALEAGFSDQAHFCRTFKRIVGEAPGSYRRRLAV